MVSIQKFLCSDRAIIALSVLLFASGLYVQGHHALALAFALLTLMIPVNEAFVLIVGVDALLVDAIYLVVCWTHNTSFQ